MAAQRFYLATSDRRQRHHFWSGKQSKSTGSGVIVKDGLGSRKRDGAIDFYVALQQEPPQSPLLTV